MRVVGVGGGNESKAPQMFPIGEWSQVRKHWKPANIIMKITTTMMLIIIILTTMVNFKNKNNKKKIIIKITMVKIFDFEY